MLEETRPDGNGRARGLVSSRKSGARIEARTFSPSPELRPLVRCHWVTRWDLRGQPPHTAEILSDPCVNIAFEAGKSRIVGVSTRLFRRELSGAGVIRAVKFRAGAARLLFRMRPIASFTDLIVPLETAFDDARSIEEEVLAAPGDDEGLACIERWLSSHLDPSRLPQAELAAMIVERIAREPDLSTMARVALASGLSARPLQRLFREHVGASPKWVIRRLRLQEAALRLERGDVGSLAALAAELGYSDHGHFSRDFKAASGRSPAEFRASDSARPPPPQR